jgi:hypothetical protein
MTYRDTYGQSDLRAAFAARRLRTECHLHPKSRANGVCDVCALEICGACIRSPIDGGTFCPPCLKRRRGQRYGMAAGLIVVLAVVCTVGIVGLIRATSYRANVWNPDGKGRGPVVCSRQMHQFSMVDF